MTGLADELDAVVAAGRMFHSRGWVPATGGNFSVRVDGRTRVTASGLHKGELTRESFVEVDADGQVIDADQRASAEAGLHAQLYAFNASTGAVLHTHSVASTVLSRRLDAVVLRGYELQKILEGISTHEAEVRIPVFENDQDIPRLAGRIGEAMSQGTGIQGYLIRGHGLYAWGATAAMARYRIEALEFLMECELHAGDRKQ